ncbi:hypothetical protein GW17_00042056 [Ensete ventricosum]|nr:hypothetical protein GW17_00042056 [Ensete ventricosum]
MAGKRTSASLMADEVVRQKETSLSGKSSSGYFGAVFPSTSTATAKGLPQLDLYWTLNKRSTDTNTGSAQRMTTGSVHAHYKTHGENISGNSNIATRGEWWQGNTPL